MRSNHAPVFPLMLSGAQIPGRSTLGAWLTYGIGQRFGKIFRLRRHDFGEPPGQAAGRSRLYWGSGFLRPGIGGSSGSPGEMGPVPGIRRTAAVNAAGCWTTWRNSMPAAWRSRGIPIATRIAV